MLRKMLSAVLAVTLVGAAWTLIGCEEPDRIHVEQKTTIKNVPAKEDPSKDGPAKEATPSGVVIERKTVVE